jgi:hypothetical protein
MSAQKVKPPKGWRLMKPHHIIRKGDKFCGVSTGNWYQESGDGVGYSVSYYDGFVRGYARRITPIKGKK